jgi:hypothetical protein
MRPRLTFANVVSCIALFVALGSGAYAATQLPKNSVGSKQIKKNAVKSAKVKDRSLKAIDFAEGQLPAGPQGPKGDRGAAGATSVVVRRAVADTIGAGTTGEETVFCNDGEHLVGGGAAFVNGENKYVFPATLEGSVPIGANSRAALEGEEAIGWRASATNETGSNKDFVVIALCAKP